jgi:hypothetical protein
MEETQKKFKELLSQGASQEEMLKQLSLAELWAKVWAGIRLSHHRQEDSLLVRVRHEMRRPFGEQTGASGAWIEGGTEK